MGKHPENGSFQFYFGSRADPANAALEQERSAFYRETDAMISADLTRGAEPAARTLSWLKISFGVLLLAAALPILAFKIPILADYPNHLARMYAIAWLDQDKLLANYYSIEWHVVPNLAVDAIVPLLARLIGIYAAGKLFVLLIAALTAGGTVALHRALFRRASPWPLAAFLFLYNFIFLYGFLNYLFAAALALWGAAAWIRLRRATAWRRGAVSALFVLALFASHFLGLALYGFAVLCYEAWRWYERRPTWPRLVRNALAFGLPFLIVPPLLLLSPTSGFTADTVWTLWPQKFEGLYYTFKSYNAVADGLFALALAAGVAWGLWTRRLRPHPVALIYLPAAALVYLAAPTMLADAGVVDMRLPSSFVFFAIAFCDWQGRSAREAKLFLAAVLALTVAHLAVIGAYWHHFDRIIAEFGRSFERIAPGSRVLVASNPDGARWTYKTVLAHVPALVVIERSAMESLIFTHPGKQPLHVKPEWRDITPYDGDALLVEDLAATDRGDPTIRSVNPIGTPQTPYWRHWRQDYDYLYVLYTPQGYQPPLKQLEPLYRTDFFQLYRIPHGTIPKTQ
jgi:hypothetical protein